MKVQRTHIIAGFAIFTVLIVLLTIQRDNTVPDEEQKSLPDKSRQAQLNGLTLKGSNAQVPVPHIQRSSESPNAVPDAKAKWIYAQFHVPKLTLEEAETFVAQNQRSAASLVAAFRTSGEARFLAEAMKEFPNDPQVAFEAFFNANLPSEERRKWADALKQAAPDNALANYLSAQEYFKSGQTDLAMRELEEAFGKTKFNDLTLERMQFNEEAYRASGYSELSSRATAMFQLPLPLLKEMSALAENTIELSRSYQRAGDTDLANTAVAIAMNLGEQYRDSGKALLVHQMLGMGIKESALKTLDPEAVLAPDGKTSQHLLDELNAERAALTALVRETVPLQDRMTPQDWIGYIDRMRLLGEPNAMRWLLSKYGPQ